jgi:hypothetical protein
MHTAITNQADKPIEIPNLEYNNVYPGKAGRCMMFAPTKEYSCTLMVDRDGVVWKYPHQHVMHYRHKIAQHTFAPGSLSGFFGEETGNPVVVCHRGSTAPDWAICDMYYDLHCCGRPERAMQPGETWDFDYTIKYLGKEE